MKTWSKTVLSVYKYLEALSNSIDKIVLKKSINSAFYNNGRYNSCYDCASKIMRLTERKINLINLKVLVEDTLERLSVRNKQILVMSYIDGAKSEDIANLMGISLRTFFRNKNDALDSFAKNLVVKGFNKEKLEEMFSSENWLRNLYNKNTESDCEINKYNFFRSVVGEFTM